MKIGCLVPEIQTEKAFGKIIANKGNFSFCLAIYLKIKIREFQLILLDRIQEKML